MSFGLPVLPPDVGALNDAETTGVSESEDSAASGSKPTGTVGLPGASAGSTPTMPGRSASHLGIPNRQPAPAGLDPQLAHALLCVEVVPVRPGQVGDLER